MMCIVEEIGKSFLDLNEVMEFKEEYEKLYSLADYKNPLYYNFFHSSLEDENQFESFLVASLVLFDSFPEDLLPILEMVKNYCIPPRPSESVMRGPKACILHFLSSS